jgi:serine/threonine-protein kinase
MARKRAQQRKRTKRGGERERAPEKVLVLPPPAPPASAPPRYQILESLGAGGMGEVFKARLTGAAGFQRDVVLKRLHAQNAGDGELATMFADEARLLGFLRHPNIVQALDFREEAGQRFLVLEYLEGATLAQILRDGRDVPPAMVAFVGREICRALDYVHGVRAADGAPLEVVHHDVTPSNIILTDEGAVKLLDFGLARFTRASHVPRAEVVKGKPSYLAPEQLRGARVDGRADLFALGIVLHECLTGVRLFRGDDDAATLRQVLEKPIAAPSKVRAGVPRALDRIVMRALERDPERRYASAALMARDLDEVVLSSRLRPGEVAAFARGISSPAQAALAAPRGHTRAGDAQADAPTRRELPIPFWVKTLPGARRTALVAGLGLALGLGTLALGARHRDTRRPSLPAASTMTREPRANSDEMPQVVTLAPRDRGASITPCAPPLASVTLGHQSPR